MKILKIFGIVVGIHVFALVLIFANPGCSSTNKPASAPADSTAKNEEMPARTNDVAPVIIAPTEPSASVPATFDPNAPAPAVRFSPTRPGTPAASALEAQPVADVTPATTYTVGKGDSLWTIAKKNHTTVAEIAAANNIKASATVRLGQKLIIPGKPVGPSAARTAEPVATRPAAADVTPAPRASRETVKHVVKPGETLGGIARKYQVKVGEIATANNITDPAKIRPGMELTIPGWQAAGKSSRGSGNGAAAATVPASTSVPATVEPASSNPPTLAIPSGEADPSATPPAAEPPVIKVDENPGK